MTLLRAQSLHALAYCERLFYLEEVEELRLADAAVYAGRRLHTELAREEGGLWHTLDLESEWLGIRGRVDCIRRAEGQLIPYEHKRGRAARPRPLVAVKSRRNSATEPDSPPRTEEPVQNESETPVDSQRPATHEAWPSDRIQVAAYAMLLEDVTGQPVDEGRVRYHQDNVTVRVRIDLDLRQQVKDTIARANALAGSIARPPVTSNERLCARCSLAPACLPEEARRAAELRRQENLDVASAAKDASTIECDEAANSSEPPELASGDGAVASHEAAASVKGHPVLRMFPADDRRQALHVVTQGARVGRSGDQLEVAAPGEPGQVHPSHEIGQVVLHGFAQISTQALRLCGQKGIGVHWVTQGGSYVGCFSSGPGSVQRRIRQYEALRDTAFCLSLARRLAEARILSQLRFLLRATRGPDRETAGVESSLEGIRRLFPALKRAASLDELRGVEGRAGAFYFSALPGLIDEDAGARMKPSGRSRRPPRDPFNAIIGFGYAMLLKDVMSAIMTVGLDPSLGFYHQPRSQAHPLALDLIELFRVPMVDLPVVASINRKQWDADGDFRVAGSQVWLSEEGRARLIELYERRKSDEWKHPVLGYSLSYARLIELEVRLLEKEWTGEPGLFARMRLR